MSPSETSEDIIERLAWVAETECRTTTGAAVCYDAMREMENLRREVARLRDDA